VNFTIHNSVLKGYLDPNTNIIESNSLPIDCIAANNILLGLKGKYYFYNREVGALKQTFETGFMETPSLTMGFAVSNLTLQKTYYHEYLMYNLSDFTDSLTFQSIFQMIEKHNDIFEAAGAENNMDISSHQQAVAVARRLQHLAEWAIFSTEISISMLWDLLIKLFVSFQIIRIIAKHYLNWKKSRGDRKQNTQITINVEKGEEYVQNRRQTPIIEEIDRSMGRSISSVMETERQYEIESRVEQKAIEYKKPVLMFNMVSEESSSATSDQSVELETTVEKLAFVTRAAMVSAPYGNIWTEALIDTGARFTFMSETELRKMIEDANQSIYRYKDVQKPYLEKEVLTDADEVIIDASGKQIDIKGKIKLEMTLVDKRLSERDRNTMTVWLDVFITSAVKRGIVLGMDFICCREMQGWSIDFRNRMLLKHFPSKDRYNDSETSMMDFERQLSLNTHEEVVCIRGVKSNYPLETKENIMVLNGRGIMPVVAGRLNGCTVPMLIDSGATRSLCPGTLQGICKKGIKPASLKLASVSGHAIPLKGLAVMDFSLGDGTNAFKIEHAFHVMDEPYKYVIIGLDIIQKLPSPMTYDVEKEKISFGNITMKILGPSYQETVARVQEQTTVPPRSFSHIKAGAEQKLLPSQNF